MTHDQKQDLIEILKCILWISLFTALVFLSHELAKATPIERSHGPINASEAV